MNDFLELTQGLIEKNDFEETEFQPLPAGDYRVKVANVEKKVSQSGNEYVAMVMEVIDGEYTARNIYNNVIPIYIHALNFFEFGKVIFFCLDVFNSI